MVVSAQRDIGAPDEVNEGVNSSFVLVQGIALRPEWRVTEKLKVSAFLDYSDWEYLGDPGLVLGTVPPRSDQVRTLALALGYQPLRNVSLDLGLRRENRSSSIAFGDYAANIVSLGARLSF